MKFLGADIYAFYHEWPMGECWYHDCADLLIEKGDGSPALDLGKKYSDGELGLICWQSPPASTGASGNVQIGSLTLQGGSGTTYDFSRVLSAWLKARAEATIVLSVLKDQLEEVKALAAARKWKVISG